MYAIGIDLGGTNLKGGLCNESGVLLEKLSVPTGREATADSVMDGVARMCFALLERTGVSAHSLDYVGIAVPGTADAEKGELVYANNLPFLHYPLVQEFSSRFPYCRVCIENDANAAALGEALCGSAVGCSDMVLITLGTGLGSGMIIDGKIYSGFNCAAGEWGHTVVNAGGRLCTCGRRGCWEAYSSAVGLIRSTREAMERHRDSAMWELCGGDPEKVDGQTAFRAADRGDKAAKRVVRSYIRYLSCGIINTINVLQPQMLCIGGGISNEGDNLFRPLIRAVETEQYSRNCEKKTLIRMASLGNDAGIIGAAMLGRQGETNTERRSAPYDAKTD